MYESGCYIPQPERTVPFDEEIINKLQQIQWWNWSYDKIQRFLSYIISGDVDKL